MKWNPTVYTKMYLDDIDSQGLLFWYNEILKDHLEKDD